MVKKKNKKTKQALRDKRKIVHPPVDQFKNPEKIEGKWRISGDRKYNIWKKKKKPIVLTYIRATSVTKNNLKFWYRYLNYVLRFL